ncbi:ribonuclease inhibitor [Paenibacillus sp. FSL K6-2862]|uniref:ribonuclease inhibitor n=1 Tax=Paenibacillus sp. FSL K6-2862 TaxID=2921484 RepID=UPI0030F7D69A
MAKYLILDDENEMIVGTCEGIIGLSGECQISDEHLSLYKLKLEGFIIDPSFKAQCIKTRCSITNIHLGILDGERDVMGYYYFSMNIPLYFHKSGKINQQSELELTGTFLTKASKEALAIWEMWREVRPAARNLWSTLTEIQKEGWLEVTRLSFKLNQEDKRYEVYSFDATYVVDVTSFFCALGEAINGPGGYFGFDLLSLEDCLYGGFGPIPPFTINLKNVTDFFRKDTSFLRHLNEVIANSKIRLVID